MNFFRRIPLLPALLTIAVVFSSAASLQPVRDVVTAGDVADAYLERPLAYVVMAPLSDVLDTLTLLSAAQHGAVLIGAIVIFAMWRAFKRKAGFKRHLIATATFLGSIVVLYAAMAYLPRPMAALRSNNPNLVKIDFHAHSDASHDGHQSVDKLRAWHTNAGFDVAYIADHATVAAAEKAVVSNPPAGTAGTTLLQSIEATWEGEHVGIPNAERVYKGILNAKLSDVDTGGLRLASFVPGREPVVIWNHPRRLGALPPVTGPGTIGVRAIEIVNGAPKDAGNLQANREQIVFMAQGGGVALVSGTDNHGFGYAAPGWTLMMILGWRGAEATALGLEIEKVIRGGGFKSTRVVQRRIADPGNSPMEVALSIVSVPATMFRTMSDDERGWWLVWIWLITGASWWIRRRRTA